MPRIGESKVVWNPADWAIKPLSAYDWFTKPELEELGFFRDGQLKLFGSTLYKGKLKLGWEGHRYLRPRSFVIPDVRITTGFDLYFNTLKISVSLHPEVKPRKRDIWMRLVESIVKKEASGWEFVARAFDPGSGYYSFVQVSSTLSREHVGQVLSLKRKLEELLKQNLSKRSRVCLK